MGFLKPFVRLGPDALATAQEIEENTIELVQKTALLLHEELVEYTPVDTGFARLNWLFSLDTPRFDTVELGADTGIVAVFQYDLGDTLWIVNNVPYIGALNRGHSPQAPAYWIDDTIYAVAEKMGGVKLLEGERF